MLQIIIAIIGSGAFSAIISAIISAVNTRKSKNDKLEKAVGFLLLAEIKLRATDLIQQGEITSAEALEFELLYSTYKSLGMNGFAELLHDRVSKLPIK